MVKKQGVKLVPVMIDPLASLVNVAVADSHSSSLGSKSS